MKILDKYILTQFVRNFMFGIFCFIVIFILVDLFENLDKFIDKNLSYTLIALYYIYFIPEILKLITPVAMLLACLFTTTRFSNYSEMTAMNSAGISIYRFSVSILIFSILITALSLYFNGWVVPISNSKKLSIERTYLGKHTLAGTLQNLHIQDSDNLLLSMEIYDEVKRTGSNASIQVFNKQDFSKLMYRFDIKVMQWDTIKNEWKLVGVSKRGFDSTSVNYTSFDTVYPSQLQEIRKIYISPSQIIKKQLKPDELLLTDLEEFINFMEESGQNVPKAKVDYYSKISFPFANLIVIIFGLSLSSNRRKSGVALQFGTSILVTFIYLGFIKISQTFGYSGDINPILTAWLANIIFLFIALLNLLRINIYGKS